MSKLFLHFGQIFEERTGILSIIRPVARKFDVVSVQERDTSARAGEFEGQNLHRGAPPSLTESICFVTDNSPAF